MAKHISGAYANACEAALAFYNVRIIDSAQLSSGIGILVLYAKELSESGLLDPDVIVEKIEEKKEKIRSTFVIDTTNYMYKSGHISNRMHKLCDAFMLHPMMTMNRSSIGVAGLWGGGIDKAREKYRQKLFGNPDDVDKSVLFITYSGIKRADIEDIKEDIEEEISFEKIYIQKACPSVSINCGPGTFGLMYSRK
jgi:DegV family protein with EDD domain